MRFPSPIFKNIGAGGPCESVAPRRISQKRQNRIGEALSIISNQ